MKRMILPLLLMGFAGPAAADVLLIEEVRAAESQQLPKNGINKSAVSSNWGEPAQRHAAVGDPPISRWDYDRFSVYFEYDTVLSTVLRAGEVVE